MVSIRHVLFTERNEVHELHPELHKQYPAFAVPYLAQTTEYPPDFPYVFYALENGVVASYIDCFCDTLWKDGQQYKWAWNGNLFTDPAFRGRGLAQQIIQDQLTEFAKRGYVWGGTFSSDPALRLYEKLHFTIVGSAPRMCLLRNPRPFLTHHLPGRISASIASVTFRTFYEMVAPILFRQKRFRRSFRLEGINVEELTEILRRHPIHYGDRAHWNDDPALLRAKMEVRNSDQIALVRNLSGDPLLFFLWRVRETAERPIKEKYSGVRMFSVMEYAFLAEPRAPDALIEAAITLFEQANGDLLEIVSAPPDLESAARSHGFISLGTGMSFTFMAPPGHPLQHLKTSVADWNLTHYSGDGYSFE